MDATGAETHVSLRPPLPWLPSFTEDATRDDDCSSSSSSFWILLVRSYLACDVLRLSTETRFTALVLLHRYCYHFSARTKASLNGEKDETCHDEKVNDKFEGSANSTADHNLHSDAKGATTNQHDDNDDFDDDDDDDNLPWIAAACIFLACKAEEEPRRLRDIVNMVHTVLLEKEQQLEQQPLHESVHATSTTTTTTIPPTPLLLQLDFTPPPLHKDYWASKKRVIDTEQVVLRWLGFGVSVSHPHRCVLLILDLQQKQHQQQQQQLVASGGGLHGDKKNSHINNKNDHGRLALPLSPPPGLVLVSFRRLNDALFSARALRHPVMVLACAALELALDELLPSTGRRKKDEKEEDDDYNGAVTSSEGFHSLFGPLWWTSYRVSTESLKACKEDLGAAKSSLIRSGSSSTSQAATS